MLVLNYLVETALEKAVPKVNRVTMASRSSNTSSRKVAKTRTRKALGTKAIGPRATGQKGARKAKMEAKAGKVAKLKRSLARPVISKKRPTPLEVIAVW